MEMTGYTQATELVSENHGVGRLDPGGRMADFTLQQDGDQRERRWGKDVGRNFPRYEEFWRKHVVPVTFRVLHRSNLYMRPSVPAHLRRLGTAHYWIFCHLAGAYEILQLPDFPDVGQLYDFYSRLSSVLSPDNSLLLEVLRAEWAVVKHYGGRPRGRPKDLLPGYPKPLEANLRAANERIDDYRNWLQHNGGLPILGGRIPKNPRDGKYDLSAIAKLLDAPPRDFVDATQQAKSDLAAVERALNDIWGVMLDDLGRIEDQAGYQRDRDPDEADRALARDVRLLPVCAASPVYAPAPSQSAIVGDVVNLQSNRSR